MLLTGNVSIEPWCTRAAAVGLPVPLEMMPWWRRWGWSVRHQKRTIHIIFIGATSALCFHQKYATINQSINQSINIFIANSQLSIIIYYTAKKRAPKFYAGLLQILCWEPGGLPSFKVSGDPWLLRWRWCSEAWYHWRTGLQPRRSRHPHLPPHQGHRWCWKRQQRHHKDLRYWLSGHHGPPRNDIIGNIVDGHWRNQWQKLTIR